MENSTLQSSDLLISEAYVAFQDRILRFINSRVGNMELAKDLSQDTFLRLLGMKVMIRQETILAMLYMIASNLVIDYLRRNYTKQEINSYIYDCSVKYSNETEEQIIATDLARYEMHAIHQLPTQRKIIYTMSRFQGLSTKEIAGKLGVSFRTVDNHLYIGRKEVREYVEKLIS